MENTMDWYRDLRSSSYHEHSPREHESNFQLVRDLPNAPNTCQASLNQTEEKIQPLQINGLPTIAVDAFDRGLLESKFNRKRGFVISNSIKKKL
jgi:hypothetical protein